MCFSIAHVSRVLGSDLAGLGLELGGLGQLSRSWGPNLVHPFAGMMDKVGDVGNHRSTTSRAASAAQAASFLRAIRK